jgi:sedoheptulose-bisphosphatase
MVTQWQTPNGERRIRATGRALVGNDRLIVPKNLAHIYVSPRKRAQRTLELLGLGCTEPMPWEHHGDLADVNKGDDGADEDGGRETKAKIEITEAVREWDYGDYEGITSQEIRQMRKERGEPEWDIWRDGCPGGESVYQTQRKSTYLRANAIFPGHRSKSWIA